MFTCKKEVSNKSKDRVCGCVNFVTGVKPPQIMFILVGKTNPSTFFSEVSR